MTDHPVTAEERDHVNAREPSLDEPRRPLHQLESLEQFFSVLPVHPVDGVPAVLHPLVELRHRLRQPECRITFLGAVKTGKSSLLNGLLGATVLPVLGY